MLGTTFYNESFRKILVAFGTLFNNISIVRSDEVYKVPMKFPTQTRDFRWILTKN